MNKIIALISFQDNEDPKDGRFDVDGDYVPRIVFLGKVTVSTP